MLNDKINKKKFNDNKTPMLTWVNPANSWLKSWDRDNLIEKKKKSWNLISNQ
jgi:hypothetical protein